MTETPQNDQSVTTETAGRAGAGAANTASDLPGPASADASAPAEAQPRKPDPAADESAAPQNDVADAAKTPARPEPMEQRAQTRAPAGLPLRSADLPDLGTSPAVRPGPVQPIDLLHDVDLRVRIELGRTRLNVEEVLQLGEGSVVELDKLAGDPVDVFVNERLVARGEVLVLNDNFCVRVSEVISDENERVLN